ncbi:retinol dehydrogenase 11-like isoform X2 [Malurus melanocephalus]|uniref:retinol dehydrogenase 11-like isoform X2 n=1 Tax=Malurus melanocephalus TaxID=175006 RepID=UPI002546F595|nr:retinol dehydrogenase 11-like isoform X2 [Malurus melanocephalus]
MELLGTLSPPWWLLLLLLLGLLIWLRRRSPWDPRKCPTDLTGKTVIVTGANSGIGKCVAMDLARRNARTILACRSRERGQAAVEEIQAATGNPAVVLRLLDTSSLASVRAFASAVLREEPRLDVLVNNAGVTGLPFTITSEGLEQTFTTNYLGPFLLTNLLLGVTVNAISPGVVNTGIMRHFSYTVRAVFSLFRPFMKSAEQGAASTIFCAVSEEAEGISGKYFDSNCRLSLPSEAARDTALARKLWEASERLTGLTKQD